MQQKIVAKQKKILDLESRLRLWESYHFIAGVDESGMGALAGPVVVAAVILPPNFQSVLIQDSKILSSRQRELAYQLIKDYALEYSIVVKEVFEIEQKNPLVAAKEGMQEAVSRLVNFPHLCLIDGKTTLTIDKTQTLSIIGGDHQSISIAAASILAKVTRDLIMQRLYEKYPTYGWNSNKGYASKDHLKSIFFYGICNLHRKNYEPIKSLVKPDCDLQKLKKKYDI